MPAEISYEARLMVRSHGIHVFGVRPAARDGGPGRRSIPPSPQPVVSRQRADGHRNGREGEPDRIRRPYRRDDRFLVSTDQAGGSRAAACSSAFSPRAWRCSGSSRRGSHSDGRAEVLESPHRACHGYRMFTARAANSVITVSEMMDWSIIRTLPHRASAGVSVGEKAVLVLKARNR
jgi:hypothetical protein